MTVLASDILDRVRSQLIDDGVTKRWDDPELLRWMSDGQRTCVAMSPSLGEVTTSHALIAGTRQVLPDDTVMLLDVKRNMGVDGATPGRAIRVTDRDLLDSLNPDWHTGPASSIVQNYIYDPEQPKSFYVFPPSTGTTKVELSRSQVPPELTVATDEITISDLYRTALTDYVMFKAHQKDSDYAAGEGKAGIYLNLFLNFMGSHESAKLSESPNRGLAPADLSVKGAAK